MLTFKKLVFKREFQIKPWIHSWGSNSRLHIYDSGIMEIAEHSVSKGNLTLTTYGKLKIGKNCFFNNNCAITCLDKIQIGDNCIFGNNIVIVDHDHDFKSNDFRNKFVTSPVSIGNNVWIGANSIVLRGTVIGNNAVIAAGSVVRGIVESNTVYYQHRQTDSKTI